MARLQACRRSTEHISPLLRAHQQYYTTSRSFYTPRRHKPRQSSPAIVNPGRKMKMMAFSKISEMDVVITVGKWETGVLGYPAKWYMMLHHHYRLRAGQQQPWWWLLYLRPILRVKKIEARRKAEFMLFGSVQGWPSFAVASKWIFATDQVSNFLVIVW